jgi:hypothetical protein
MNRGVNARRTKPTSHKRLLALLLLLPAVAGCRSLPPLPPVNLSQPGWTVRQGQAVWRPAGTTTEVAGEILVATSTNGAAFLQFSKTPFPLVVAQLSSNDWQIEFSTENKRFSGRGNPPSRLIWLWLGRMLLGEPPPKNWSWRLDNNGWRLENRATGEAVEGYFAGNEHGLP